MKSILLIVSLFMSTSMTLIADEIPRIQIKNTEYIGSINADKNQYSFKGIPYAKPPIDDLRWQSPSPITDYPGIIDARKFKPVCMQTEYIINWYKDVVERFTNERVYKGFEEMSEDCLFLNIWTNSTNLDNKKPVMVFVHGGADTGGWSYEPNYHGHNLAEKDVVVVSINYRLNVFGFLKHPEMADDDGNFGLEDEIMALQWIKDNISFFGGDANNVTYFGESAGGAHVSYLMVSPKGKNLFQRGIIQSGGYNLFKWLSKEQALEFGKKTQTAVNALDLQSMKNLPAETLLNASTSLYYRPFIDGKLIPDNLVKLFDEGMFNNIDLMIGSNKNEEYLYVEEDISEQDITQLIEDYYPDNKEELLSMLDLSNPRLAMDRLGTNQETACPSIFIARSVAKNGNNVYQYYFTRKREGSEEILAYHGAEIPYVFNTHDDWLPTNSVDDELTKAMMEYWVEFAKKGTPNSIENPTWKEFGSEENYLILDENIENGAKLENSFCEIMIKELKERILTQ